MSRKKLGFEKKTPCVIWSDSEIVINPLPGYARTRLVSHTPPHTRDNIYIGEASMKYFVIQTLDIYM
jgi:hypothetical protein